MCLFGFKFGDIEDQGRILDIVIGEELCGGTWCTWSGIFMLAGEEEELAHLVERLDKTSTA